MSKRKKKNISLITWILICVLLSIACVITVGLFLLTNSTNNLLQQRNQELEAENNSLKEEINSMQELITAQREVSELEDIASLRPGAIVEAEKVEKNIDGYFLINDIIEGDEIYNRINGKSYRENPNIQLSDLKYLKVIHYNYNHQIQVGEIIVNTAISSDVLNIFKELFAIEYEVQSMYLIDNYWTGDGNSSDSESIDANNTSAFCYRQVTGGNELSNHALGCAIDINPQQNPYVWYENGEKRWSHSNADPYVDRESGDSHIIVKGDDCYNIFIKYGFSWGGEWQNPIDYQHFETYIN